jgi:conjugal transfer pilus assembly protein TraW
MRRNRVVLALMGALCVAPAFAQSVSTSATVDGSALGKALAQKVHAGTGDAPKNSAGYALGALLKQRTEQGSAAGNEVGQDVLSTTQDAVMTNQTALATAIAQSEAQNGRAFLTDTDNGMPVLPPGMTVKQASQYVSHDWPAKREKTAHLFILVSLGMPKAVLENLFRQVAASPVLRNETVFMLQGWKNVPQGFQDTVALTQSLQPAGPYHSPVLIDPTWFESLHINRVPAIVVANTDHNGMIMGDGLSILDARSRIRVGKDLGRTFGQTWRITEPDALKMIQDAAKKVDLSKWQDKARQSIWPDLAKKAPALPEVAQTVSTTFDPSVIATRDLTLPDGRIVVHAGQRINPLDQSMPWDTLRFIVFDANKPWQIRQAQAWAKTYPNARILMAAPPDTEQGWITIEHAFGGTPVKLIEPFVAQRLGVRAAPSMVWPDGQVLRVFVQAHPVKE